MNYFSLPFIGIRLQVALVALIVAPSFILFGYNQAVLGSLLSLRSWVEIFPQIDTVDTTGAEKAHNSTSQGACNASFQMGCLIGALSLSYYGDKLGRRKTTFIGAAITIIGQVLQLSATTLTQFVVGRVILGFAIAGYLYRYLPSSSTQWRVPLAIPLLFSVILLVFIFSFPESPRWLVSKRRITEATSSLRHYRGPESSETEISREISGIELAFESTERSSLKDIFSRNDKTRLLYRFWLCMGLNFFQQACGGNLISVYSSTIFENYLNLSPHMAKILASCVLMWKTLCCLISFWAIDRWGRRLSFMISGTGMSVCMAVLAITTSFNTITHPMAIAYVAFMFVFNFFYPIGFMGGNFLYTSEVAPARLRAAISSLATANHWLWNLVVVLVTPVAIDTIGYWYYVMYALISITIPVCIYIFYPETMGRNLELVDKIFVEAPSIWKIVPYARALPEQQYSDDTPSKSEKFDAADDVEMREYV